MEPTHSAPVMRDDLSAGMTRANNVDFSFTTQNYLLNRKPDFLIYLYNVSEQSFKVSRPPIIREMTIPGKKPGERYAFVTSLPSPILMPKANVDSSEINVDAMDGRRLAMDIINPDNTGIDQDAAIDPRSVTSQGVNLGARGVFYSLNNPPTDAEINRAVDRLEKHYTTVLEKARAVEVSRPGDIAGYVGPEEHAAADYFAEQTSWHGRRSKPADCPNCGARIVSGTAFHKTDEGTMCIIDWPRAVKAGVRTRQQAFDATGDEQFAPKAETKPTKSQD